MKIILDVMGGDNAPKAPIEGALLARREYGCEIVLVGQEEVIRETLVACGEKSVPAGMEIVDAREVIRVEDEASTAFRQRKDSSLSVGLTMLRDGLGDGFVSAGNTGALLAGATLIVKRIRGLRRAALAPLIPTATGRAVLLDCGANAECTVEYLLQFAYLGSFYASRVLGIEKPRVGLLNIGAEETKGDKLRIATYERLREAGAAGELNFYGNVEAKEALLGACDVIVADGFSGNVMLKTIEGAGSYMGKRLKSMLLQSVKTKIAALLIRGEMRDFKKPMDPEEVGGTALLGISAPVIKVHGSAGKRAFQNGIRQAIEVAQGDLAEQIAANIDKMTVKKTEAEQDFVADSVE